MDLKIQLKNTMYPILISNCQAFRKTIYNLTYHLHLTKTIAVSASSHSVLVTDHFFSSVVKFVPA